MVIHFLSNGFFADNAQNTVNPNGLISILTRQCGKSSLKKAGSDYSACLSYITAPRNGLKSCFGACLIFPYRLSRQVKRQPWLYPFQTRSIRRPPCCKHRTDVRAFLLLRIRLKDRVRTDCCHACVTYLP